MDSKLILTIMFLGILCGTAEAVIMGELVRDRSKFPYMVFIIHTSDKQKICGGSILNDRHILTSAACILRRQLDNPSYVEVYAGTLQLTSSNPVRYVKKVVKINNHPSYKKVAESNGNYHLHDIAVLQIESLKDNFGSFVNKIDVATQRAKDGTWCEIAGWGSTIWLDNRKTNNDLQSIKMQIFPEWRCKYEVDLTWWREKMFCAINIDRYHAPHWGDHGGALVCNGEVHGIFSWHTFESGPNAPVFIDAVQYRNWIIKFEPTPRPLQELIPVSKGMPVHDRVRPLFIASYFALAVLFKYFFVCVFLIV